MALRSLCKFTSLYCRDLRSNQIKDCVARNVHTSLLPYQQSRSAGLDSVDPAPVGKHVATLVPGDGVWPELMNSVHDLFEAAAVPIEFEEIPLSEVTRGQHRNLHAVVESFKRNKIGLKGVLTTPKQFKGGVLQTMNLKLRRQLDLFANVCVIRSLPGFKTRHDNIDLVVIREQTEGEYSALEHESIKGVVESMKIVTYKNTERIAKFAFDYALRHNRKKVTAIHKANIMKLGDGLFLRTCQEVSELYPTIEFDSMIIDNCCMQLVAKPQQFDVMVMGNLYGGIVDNVASGLVGGAGVVPGESYSRDIAVFEPGSRHPYAKAVGKNIANPTALILSAVLMCKHLSLHHHANRIKSALLRVIEEGKVLTEDMGGKASTTDFTREVIANLPSSAAINNS